MYLSGWAWPVHECADLACERVCSKSAQANIYVDTALASAWVCVSADVNCVGAGSARTICGIGWVALKNMNEHLGIFYVLRVLRPI